MVIETTPMANLFGTSRNSGFGMGSNQVQRLINDIGSFGLCPIGSIIGWNVSFGLTDSGTCGTIGAETKKLKEAGQNFLTTVQVGMTAVNTSSTPAEYTIVTSIVSNTELNVRDDIFDDGDTYNIYKTPSLPEGWLICDGSVIDDQDSVYDGETLPELNAALRFLKGGTTSGSIGGSISLSTGGPSGTSGGGGGDAVASSNHTHTITDGRPPYYDVVWIMRIK